MEPIIFQVEGQPLSELGLENAVIRFADGSIEPFTGFVQNPGESIREAIEACLPDGASLFLSREDAERETKQPNWLPLERFGSAYEEELDVNSRDSARRHRRRTATGEPVEPWTDGPAPN